MAALPTTLADCEITSVISNARDAYGLKRAAAHSPPIPASSFSPYNYQKAHPEDFAEDEREIKRLDTLAKDLLAEGKLQEADKAKQDWTGAKKALAARIKPLYQLELAGRVQATKPDLIVLAGFMLILLPATLETLVRDWVEDELSERIEAEGTLSTEGASPYPSDQPPLAKGTPIPIINLHPALPGSFVGPHVIEDAWEAFNQRAVDSPSPTPADSLADSLAATHIDDSSSSRFGPKITKTGIMIHRVIPELDRGEPVLHREIDMREGESLDELKERIHGVEHEAIVAAVKQVTSELGDGSWWK